MSMLLIPYDVTQAKAKVTDGVKRMPGFPMPTPLS